AVLGDRAVRGGARHLKSIGMCSVATVALMLYAQRADAAERPAVHPLVAPVVAGQAAAGGGWGTTSGLRCDRLAPRRCAASGHVAGAVDPVAPPPPSAPPAPSVTAAALQ